jgi:DNA-binding transcriptional MerR regulator
LETINNEFTQKEVSELLGIKANTIAQYARHRLVVADIEDAKGRGNTRLYSRLNLLEFLFLQELSKCGFTQEKIKTIFSILRYAETYTTNERKNNCKYAENFLKAENIISWNEVFNSNVEKNRLYVIIVNPYERDFEIDMWVWVLLNGKDEGSICLPLTRHDDNIEKSINYINEEEFFKNLLIMNITTLWKQIAEL